MKEHDATEQAYKNGYEAGKLYVIGEDMVSVVRCKYCKYYNPIDSECTIKFDSSGDRLVMDAMHYCSDGKRRKEKGRMSIMTCPWCDGRLYTADDGEDYCERCNYNTRDDEDETNNL